MADAPQIDTPRTTRHELSQDAIDTYAALSGDYNPLHVDPDYMVRTSFGVTIAHGPLSLQPLFEALCEWLGSDGLPPGCTVEARFRSAVKSGSTVTAEFSRDEDGVLQATCSTADGLAIEATIEGV